VGNVRRIEASAEEKDVHGAGRKLPPRTSPGHHESSSARSRPCCRAP
jgi:hypothetical protein